MKASSSQRQTWMKGIISEFFSIKDYTAVDEFLKEPKNAKLIEEFLNGQGPPRIFFYYQKQTKENGEISETGSVELFCSTGEKEKILGKAIYFVRCTPPGKNINLQTFSDNDVLFGEIGPHMINSMEILFNKVFIPMVKTIPTNEWILCEEESKQEFHTQMDKFSQELTEALSSSKHGFTLEKYDKKNEADILNPTKGINAALMEEVETKTKNNIEKIIKALEEKDEETKKDRDEGPKSELIKWSQRLQKLTKVSEEMKLKEIRDMLDYLGQSSRSADKPKESANYIHRWKEQDIKLTEYLNEAKDNVKYLKTLEIFLEPLYSGTPQTIQDSLPALMNSIKMIHTIAKYYNKSENMTKLFTKITLQMISNCIKEITKDPYEQNSEMLLDENKHPIDELLKSFSYCTQLNEAYKKQYKETKENLAKNPKGKQFDFSESQIFSSFDLFCRRIHKLTELFKTIQQFKTLKAHNLKDNDNIIEGFEAVYNKFKEDNKEHLLAYNKNAFDRDFVSFNVKVSNLEAKLHGYIQNKFDEIHNVEQSVKFLKKFQDMLKRDSLKSDINSKYATLIHTFGQKITDIRTQFQQTDKTSLVRNMPEYAGRITWGRHLLEMIYRPIKYFPPGQLNKPEFKRFGKSLCELGTDLINFELQILEIWEKNIDQAKEGLQAPLIIEHDTASYAVNFDESILTLIREAKCLARMNIKIKESAKIVLLQEDKFKRYKYELEYLIKEYDRICGRIRSNTQILLQPHLYDLKYIIYNGMVILTWSSMNIDSFIQQFHNGLRKLEQLLITIYDIMDNRIDNKLKALSKTILVDLPEESKTYSLDSFVSMQEDYIKKQSQSLKAKNIEVENAVNDLVTIIKKYPRDPNTGQIDAGSVNKLIQYYVHSMYRALCHATKTSLNALKERVCDRHSLGITLKPFFEVEVALEGVECVLHPSLEDIQKAINKAANAVLKTTKNVVRWSQSEDDKDSSQVKTFYEWIAQEKEIVKVILLLTGSIQGTKNSVTAFLGEFKKYSSLWTDDINKSLQDFVSTNPTLDDYEEVLKKFASREADINKIENQKVIGAMALKTQKLKDGLKDWIGQWKRKYSLNLHEKAKLQMENLSEEIKQMKIKLNKEVKDILSLGKVMKALDRIRIKESTFNQELKPINDMYLMLEKYLTQGELEKEEMDTKQQLTTDWENLKIQAKSTRKELQTRQKEFKSLLLKNVLTLQGEMEEFRKDFDKNGPMCPGLSPKEALNRLKRFKEELEVKNRKSKTYRMGEDLFNLKHKDYPYLKKINADIELLDRLYNLYSQVNEKIEDWKGIHWSDMGANVNDMGTKIEEFRNNAFALPKSLQTWPAYGELKQIIEEWNKLVPLITSLSMPYIVNRHWEALKDLTKKEIPYKSESFILANLLEADLVKVQEDIEDLCDSAQRQQKIEKDLAVIDAHWDNNEFVIKNWKKRETPCVLDGKRLEEIEEKLEEHMMQLTNMNAQKHVLPFKEKVDKLLATFSEVSDRIDTWKKVQIQWISQESVFKSIDIAKSLPQETKKFIELDKKWLKIMDISLSQKKVISICIDEVIKNLLSELQAGFEYTQKRLDHYLESKRRRFPRFYFISNLVLLTVLSQGSDPDTIQEYFENLFDAISKVEFGEDKKIIQKIMQTIAKVDEEVLLKNPVRIEGNITIEDWLKKLEAEMQITIKDMLYRGIIDIKKIAGESKLEEEYIKYINANKAQTCIVALQLLWTIEAEESFSSSKDNKGKGNKKNQRATNIFKSITDSLKMRCLETLPSKLDRIKVETLVTIQVHQQNEYERLINNTSNKVEDPNNFEWQKQTRIYWNSELSNIRVSITDVTFGYVYEYLGVKDRLCITPLTDRCYITLAQALGMCYGGSPAGPAGTGKTETVKDMGRTLGVFVVVTNCGPNFSYKDMARNFKGIVQSGVWGCFDEINRISLVVLSVVAMQIETIAKAKKLQLDKFDFPGETEKILFLESSAYFITMNPGYAGRVELPENMKVQFRGVAMMLPDRQKIIEVKLASAGYTNSGPLSIKFFILYGLCEEQLSKQRHYDFGLRNILSVLRTAGNVKREDKKKAESSGNKETSEDMLLMNTLNTMNKSKLVAEDIGLFEALLKDIFSPKTAITQKLGSEVMEKVMKNLKERNIDDDPNDLWLTKINQLYETYIVRHGIMLVGPTGTGKSTIINVLIDALSDGKGTFKSYRLYPKAFTNDDMYGSMSDSQEWTEGIFSAIWKKYNKKDTKEDSRESKNSWIICDGPIDADWIENLNSVLDDNKLLTLANSDRIPMTDNVKLMFEVENLNNASPATVSRCGIIYVSPSDLSWRSIFRTWLTRRYSNKVGSSNVSTEKTAVENLMKKYVEQTKILEEGLLRYNHVIELNTAIRINSLLTLLANVLDAYQQSQLDQTFIERLFIFSLIWSLGALLEPEDREKFHKDLENFKAVPSISHQKMSVDKQTVYDFEVKKETGEWIPLEIKPWEEKQRVIQFSQLLIPTVDTYKAESIINYIRNSEKMTNASKFDNICTSTLITGTTGTSKTTAVLLLAKKFEKGMLFKRANFSSLTTPKMFQDIIDGEVDRTTGKNFEPPGGDKKTIFLDDINMPSVNANGDQETLEIVRQLIFDKGYYFLGKEKRGEFKRIEKLQYIAAMNHPGGGRNDIPNRLKRLLFTINMTLPSQKSVDNIYGSILNIIFKKFPPEITKVAMKLTEATYALREKANKLLKPTPTKFHYIFNIREISRVFQGISQATLKPEYQVIQKASAVGKMAPELFLVGLWRHECQRVFLDKLINENDKKALKDSLDKVTIEKFREISLDDESRLLTDLCFCDFMRDDEYDADGALKNYAQKVYEAIPSMDNLRLRVEEKMKQNNEQGGKAKKMDLVLFSDAMGHLLRISRVIQMSRGSIMLVGVGGSGKQSLTRLASYIAGQEIFSLMVSKTYGDSNFMEEVKGQFAKMVEGKGAQKEYVFLLTDNDIKKESFLEYISSFLSTGEIPGMLQKEDREANSYKIKPVFCKVTGAEKSYDPPLSELYTFFINWVRDKLHLVICFSPVGIKFRERFRKFPSIFNSCTIDWFLQWPEEAMISVASQFLKSTEIFCTPDEKRGLSENMGKVHNLVNELCIKYYMKMRRNVYVTPKSFLSFIKSYKSVYDQKYKEIFELEGNVTKGLKKLSEAEEGVTLLGRELDKTKQRQQESKEKLDTILKKLEEDTKEALSKAETVNKSKEQCEKDKAQIEVEAAIAQKDLNLALPALKQAEEAAKKVNNKNITELKGYKIIKDCGRFVMDCILLLFEVKVEDTREKPITDMGGKQLSFITDSFDTYGKAKLMDDTFCKDLLNFPKDEINDETCELLEPYLNLTTLFTYENAKNASAVFGILHGWITNIVKYHKQSKEVTPKMNLLSIKKAKLEMVKADLKEAERKVNEAYESLEKLKKDSKEKEAECYAISESFRNTNRRMNQAQSLINKLNDEKVRWTEDREEFNSRKKNLIGDVAICCSFISYAGPFNAEFRLDLKLNKIINDIKEKKIPFSEKLDLITFMTDDSTRSQWSVDELPTDSLSLENAIMVTTSSRFPLLIDPQGQALRWILKMELGIDKRIKTMEHPNLKNDIKNAIENGEPTLIKDVPEEIDPMLDPVLEKQLTGTGKKKKINLGEGPIDYDERFKLYMTSRMGNPHFSPELAAKTTIIDFTVTLNGLEEQLLGKVISKEQKSLEEQLILLMEDVCKNTKQKQDLNEQLLQKLSSTTGSLLDDTELIDNLTQVKIKATEAQMKLKDAQEKKIEIGEKRKTYVPVALRGSVLYFCIVEMGLVNWMYNTSLMQFMILFEQSIDTAEKSPVSTERVKNILEKLTTTVIRYISRGLFEQDKITFLTMISMKILFAEKKITSNDIMMFLKSGEALDDKGPIVPWLKDKAWPNVKAICKHKFSNDSTAFFKDLQDELKNKEPDKWQKLVECKEPENEEIPHYNDRLASDKELGHFIKLCLIRALRSDRTVMASINFVEQILGKEYIVPMTATVEEIHKDSLNRIPVLFLLSPGADPISSLEELAKRKKKLLEKVSLGEGQEAIAQDRIEAGRENGTWVVLQNCHLGIELMEKIETFIDVKLHNLHNDFRLFLTTEPSPRFPLGLLQMSLKVTNEPPRGLKAGLSRTYNTTITQDLFEKCEIPEWKPIIYGMCFMHSVIQERRKFGPIGFCIPYEFNNSDLEASLTYVERHINDVTCKGTNVKWDNIQYMVYEIQYGGRITDDQDRELFKIICQDIISRDLTPGSSLTKDPLLSTKYTVPADIARADIQSIRTNISKMDVQEVPELFGLHSFTEMVLRKSESLYMVNTLIDTQPKDIADAGAKTKDEEVKDKTEELLKRIPHDFIELEYRKKIEEVMIPEKLIESKDNRAKMVWTVPMNAFYLQEIQRLQKVIAMVRHIMTDIIAAIEGSVIMTPEIVDAINSIYDNRVPNKWMYDAAGVEISWLASSLTSWFKDFEYRDKYIREYLQGKQRPTYYWLPGFFNPAGFLTAMKQEYARSNRGIELDCFEYSTTIKENKMSVDTEIKEGAKDKGKSSKDSVSVLVFGLFLEGAIYANKKLEEYEPKGAKTYESQSKDLHTQFPAIEFSCICTGTKKGTDAKGEKPGDKKASVANTGSMYMCPIYKYAKRTSKYHIVKIKIACDNPNLYAKRGVALLCSKDY